MDAAKLCCCAVSVLPGFDFGWRFVFVLFFSIVAVGLDVGSADKKGVA